MQLPDKTSKSTEAEAQIDLTAVVTQTPYLPPADLQLWVDQLYGTEKPINVVDTLIAERRQEAVDER